MPAVETTDILSQRAFPGYGHREEERVEPLIVKALTKIAPRGKDEPFLIIRYSKGCLGYLRSTADIPPRRTTRLRTKR